MRRRALAWGGLLAAAGVRASGVKIPAKTVPGAAAMPWPRLAAPPDAQKLEQLAARIRNDLPRVRAVVVVRDGGLLFESYRAGTDPDALHDVASVAKSVTSALIGIALAEGRIASLEQKAVDLLPRQLLPARDSRFNDVTLRHLLTMTSGLGGPGAMTRVQPILQRSMHAAAGFVFQYSSAAEHLLSVILSHRTGMSAAAYAERKLFAPLGITHYNWFGDDDGYTFGSHDLFLRPQDMARIGQLYLQQGRWAGAQIVPAAYVAESVRVQVPPTSGAPHGYGFLWWPTVAIQDTPAYSAAGFGGQFIFVVPSRQLVVAAVSDQEERGQGAGFVREVVLPAVWG